MANSNLPVLAIAHNADIKDSNIEALFYVSTENTVYKYKVTVLLAEQLAIFISPQ